MDLSSLYHHHGATSCSPDGRLLASTHGSKVILRSMGLEVIASHTCPGATALNVSWSPDGLHVLACDETRGIAWVFAAETDAAEVARIDAGVEGCKGARWISDEAVAIWSDHGVLTIYSLVDGQGTPVHFPKHGPTAGWALRPGDARYLALLERHGGRDHIGVYDAHSYELARRFALSTSDAADIAWSPCGRYIAVWESPIDVRSLYGIFLRTQLAIHVYSLDGRNLATLIPPQEQDCGLGVRSVAWHPSSRYLCVGGWDGRIRIYSDLSWSLVAEVTVSSRVTSSDTVRLDGASISRTQMVFREPVDWIARTRGKGIVAFDSLAAPTALPSVRSESTKPPSIGISTLSFSHSGSLLAVTLASTPRCVHLFSFDDDAGDGALIVRPHVAAIFSEPVTHLDSARGGSSDHAHEALAVASGTQSVAVYGLQAEDATPVFEGVGVPASGNFTIKRATWTANGGALVLSNSEAFCLAHPVLDD